jgi:hypothetical protein
MMLSGIVVWLGIIVLDAYWFKHFLCGQQGVSVSISEFIGKLLNEFFNMSKVHYMPAFRFVNTHLQLLAYSLMLIVLDEWMIAIPQVVMLSWLVRTLSLSSKKQSTVSRSSIYRC